MRVTDLIRVVLVAGVLVVATPCVFAGNLNGLSSVVDGFWKAQKEQEDRDFLQQQRAYALELQRRQLEILNRQNADEKQRHLEAAAAKYDANEVAKTKQNIEDAIQNPKMVDWRASNPILWARAIEIDKELKSRPEYVPLSLSERFFSVVTLVEEEQAAILKKQGEDVRAAIDRNGKLKVWEASNPLLWARAKEIDNFLKASEQYKSLSLDARFEKVVEFVELEQKTKQSAPKIKTRVREGVKT